MRKIILCIFLVFLLFVNPCTIFGKQIFVAPQGNSDGNGSFIKPFDITTVFYGKYDAHPGDTVLLRGGDYFVKLECWLTGTSLSRVVIKSYSNEWAIIHGGITLHRGSSFVTFMDFEITGDYTEDVKRVTTQNNPKVHDIKLCTGLAIGFGANIDIKIINLFIHNLPGDGLDIWIAAINTEVYGNIINNNGWDALDRGHGHGIYSQNDTGIKRFEDNILFGNFGRGGINIYTFEGKINNYFLEGNVQFNAVFLVGGYRPANNITVIKNYMGEGGYTCFGFASHLSNTNLLALDNNFNDLKMTEWADMVFKRNKIFGFYKNIPKRNAMVTDYIIDSNSFFNNSKMQYYNSTIDFNAYQNIGFDTHSNYSMQPPEQNEIIVRPNKYEQGRANIIVYNWRNLESVKIDLGRILNKGDKFEVMDVQNYSGKPVINGVFNGDSISIPMNLTIVEGIKGDTSGVIHKDVVLREHSSSHFGVYVLRKTEY